MAAVKRYSWGFIALGVLPYVLGAIVAFGALGASYFKGRTAGKESREPEIVALKLDAERMRLASLAAEAKAEEAAKNVRVVYRTRVETIIKEADGVPAQVEVIRREANCDLPPSFRVLHDAASGNPTDPSSARTVDAATVAQTVADNYRTARETEAKLIALQSYIAQIQDAPKPN